MSNVLIGIIGVILFIGLALAGALILGDDFRSSKSSTAAAKIVADMQQMTAAINMRQLKTGQQLMATGQDANMALLIPRFLKVEPLNPYGRRYFTLSVNGSFENLPVRHIETNLGLNSDDAVASVCREIEAQRGAADPDAAIALTNDYYGRTQGFAFGCIRYSRDGNTYAFMRL